MLVNGRQGRRLGLDGTFDRGRQVYMDRRALAWLALNLDAAARLLGKPQDLTQTQSRTFTDLFSSEERFKDLRTNVTAHPMSRVRHADLHVPAGRRLLWRSWVSEADVIGQY